MEIKKYLTKPTHEYSRANEEFVVSDGVKDYYIRWYQEGSKIQAEGDWALVIRHSASKTDYEVYSSLYFRRGTVNNLTKIRNVSNPIIRIIYKIDYLEYKKLSAIADSGLNDSLKKHTEQLFSDLIKLDQKIIERMEGLPSIE